jgi:hypothetical protein
MKGKALKIHLIFFFCTFFDHIKKSNGMLVLTVSAQVFLRQTWLQSMHKTRKSPLGHDMCFSTGQQCKPQDVWFSMHLATQETLGASSVCAPLSFF